MGKALSVIITIASISLTGFLVFYFGAALSTKQVSLLYENHLVLFAMILSAIICAYLLMHTYKIKAYGLLPLAPFVVVCLVMGFYYDRINIPEGFKLIGAAAFLLLTGVAGARRIARTHKVT